MTVKSKAIIAAYYGDGPKLSYWNGCSAGGRQALKEAQRYPEDFNGIVAGSPGINWTGRAAQAVWIAQANHKDEASAIPPAKFPRHPQRGARSLRCRRRREGRHHRRSHALQIRSAGAGVQRPRWPGLPDGAAGRNRAQNLCLGDESAHERGDFPRPRAGQRTGMEHHGRAAADGHRARPFQVRGIQGPELGLPDSSISTATWRSPPKRTAAS